MSEDDDIDIESDEYSTHSRIQADYYEDSNYKSNNKSKRQAEKRAHHNALERKRRDHIKDSFCSLRDAVPSLQGEKASRSHILKKAAEYIQFMRRKNTSHQQDIEDLKRQNSLLESQIRTLEKARQSGNTYQIEAVNEISNKKFISSEYVVETDDGDDEEVIISNDNDEYD